MLRKRHQTVVHSHRQKCFCAGCRAEIDLAQTPGFAAELVDRFGRTPPEAEFLLKTISLKLLCRQASVEKIDAGEKAVVFSFHDNNFAKPERLIGWIQKNAPLVKLRPDHRVIVQRVWADERQRLSGVTGIVSAMAKLAA